jgi:dTDP-glucose 4,6-dehydratase
MGQFRQTRKVLVLPLLPRYIGAMNLLVTGGAGFIGSHFVLRHKERFPDDLVVVLDALTYAGNKDFLSPVIDRVRFIQGDIVDTPLVGEMVKRYELDAIVNFAAETHVDRSIANAIPFLHTNVLGVQALIEVCKANPELKLLHVSTDEVYGDQRDDESPRMVDDPLLPSSPYAATKASGDLMIMAAMRTHGIRAAVSRCTNNFGPHQAGEKFIPTVIRNALQNKPIPLYGQGKNKRDWLYVTDHTDALETILATPAAFEPATGHGAHAGRFFNVSANAELENIDVARTVLKLLDKPESLISFVTDRPGHDWRYAVDSRSTRALGWKPQVAFEEGLRRTIEWYRRSPR